ncbi:MAG: GlsB/YeaQ/YmgE family stress response membrane protein [Dehalococcoidales bacterium]|nr:GlsB/YeaQ/YmgE family stress response membrane protein [Dehalococcoidales bacterium]
MTVLWYILLGIVVGVIARLVLPGKENMGVIMTIVLGAAGAFIAGSIGQWVGWYTFPSWIGFVLAIVVAIILIAIYTGLKRKA